MGRRVGIGLGLVLALALAVWTQPAGDRPAEPTSTSGRVVTRFDVSSEVPETSASNERMADSKDPFVAEIDGIALSCGLDVRSACADGVCVALTRVPDLDAISGWLAFLQTSPRFVAGTAARDLGLPAGISTCAEAVGGLTGQATSVVLPGGDEVWCAAPDGSAAARALCGQAASTWYDADPAAWAATDLRVLRF